MRDEEIWRLQVFPAEERRLAKIAQLAERFGYPSAWCSDHILSGAEPVPNKRVQVTADSVRI